MKIQFEIKEKLPEIIAEIMHSDKWQTKILEKMHGLERITIKDPNYKSEACIEIWQHEIHIRTAWSNYTYRIFTRGNAVWCEYIGAYRGLLEQLTADGISTDSKELVNAQKAEKYYYKQALDGMTRAVATEHFPICGMNQDTVDLLLAQMNYKLDHWDVASKLIARVLISKSASRHIKDKALDLKNEIIKKIRDVK